jgi:hypothetical protein
MDHDAAVRAVHAPLATLEYEQGHSHVPRSFSILNIAESAVLTNLSHDGQPGYSMAQWMRLLGELAQFLQEEQAW